MYYTVLILYYNVYYIIYQCIHTICGESSAGQSRGLHFTRLNSDCSRGASLVLVWTSAVMSEPRRATRRSRRCPGRRSSAGSGRASSRWRHRRRAAPRVGRNSAVKGGRLQERFFESGANCSGRGLLASRKDAGVGPEGASSSWEVLMGPPLRVNFKNAICQFFLRAPPAAPPGAGSSCLPLPPGPRPPRAAPGRGPRPLGGAPWPPTPRALCARACGRPWPPAPPTSWLSFEPRARAALPGSSGSIYIYIYIYIYIHTYILYV